MKYINSIIGIVITVVLIWLGSMWYSHRVLSEYKTETKKVLQEDNKKLEEAIETQKTKEGNIPDYTRWLDDQHNNTDEENPLDTMYYEGEENPLDTMYYEGEEYTPYISISPES